MPWNVANHDTQEMVCLRYRGLRREKCSVLNKTHRVAEGFYVMAVLSRLLLSHVGFGFGQIGRFPIGPILVDCRFELADLFCGRIEFEFRHGINVDVVIGFLWPWVEEVHLRNSV